MPIFLPALGVVIVAVGLIDVFQTLFHPAARGTLSDWITHVIWKTFRWLAGRNRGLLTFAGPTAILANIVGWALLVVVGFALIYLPQMSAGFAYPSGISSQDHANFWGALNCSLGALITLSEGINARGPGLRLVRGLEAVLGFGLLTASVSWLLSLYPVLESRRSVAHRASLLHDAELELGEDVLRSHTCSAEMLIYGFAADLTTLRNQMLQFPISHYFHMDEPRTALAGVLPYIAELADRAVHMPDTHTMQIAGTVLGGAVEDFLAALAEVFLRMPANNKQAILDAYAREQMFEPVRLPSARLT